VLSSSGGIKLCLLLNCLSIELADKVSYEDINYVHVPYFHTYFFRYVRRHPVDVYDFEKLFANLEDARSKGLRIVRVGICLFGDGFGFLNGAKPMSSNGCYISWLNYELKDLSQLDCIGQYPKGLNHMDCWSVWEPDIYKIQAGFTVKLAHERVFVCGGIGLIKADQPQAQLFAGCLSQNADCPDRFSNVHKSQLGDMNIDLGAIRKTQQQLREFRSAQEAQPNSANITSFDTKSPTDCDGHATTWFRGALSHLSSAGGSAGCTLGCVLCAGG
jgi:hypothetical protein